MRDFSLKIYVTYASVLILFRTFSIAYEPRAIFA